MMKKAVVALAATIGLLAIAATAIACEFQFNYSEISAPLGTVGEIGVRVQKTHNNCTLLSMEEYQFTWENIQLLGETAWEEVGSNLYEKWFQVSLSQIGDGYLKISKDCTKRDTMRQSYRLPFSNQLRRESGGKPTKEPIRWRFLKLEPWRTSLEKASSSKAP